MSKVMMSVAINKRFEYGMAEEVSLLPAEFLAIDVHTLAFQGIRCDRERYTL